MAFKKTRTLPSGASGEYWKITHLSLNRLTKKATCLLDLFLTKTLSDSGAQSLGVQKRFILDLTSQELVGDITAHCYSKIKIKAASMVTPLGGSADSEKVQLDSEIASAEDC